MQRLQPVGPVVEQRQAVAPVDLDAEPATEVAGDLEARGVDDAVDLVLVRRWRRRRVGVIRSTPWASLTSTSVTLSWLKQARYSSLNVGRLHICR